MFLTYISVLTYSVSSLIIYEFNKVAIYTNATANLYCKYKDVFLCFIPSKLKLYKNMPNFYLARDQ